MSEVFSGRKGRFVSLADTITGFGCKYKINRITRRRRR
jgi:F0F1-type ATP synthase beta subunit